MTDVHHLIADRLDIWTSATEKKSSAGRGNGGKVSLYGIKKLRELILELAIRGKLSGDAPEIERVEHLRVDVRNAQDQLVKAKTIRKPKPHEPVKEGLFDIPEHWAWVRLAELCSFENGDRSKNYPNKSLLVPAGIPFVNAGHLRNGSVSLEKMNFISDDRFEMLMSGKYKENDILFCLRGSLGKVARVKNVPNGAIASSLVILRPFVQSLSDYLMLYFNAPAAAQLVSFYNNGTAQPNLSATDLAKFVVPLPPTNEQQRIMTKVDELMGLCDALEAQAEDSLKAHQTLVETCLATLTNSQTPEDLTQNWTRIEAHFDTLFTTEESIHALKKVLLSLAIRGFLVAQNDDDEPAQEAIEVCRSRIKKMVREKQIRKPKTLPAISDAEAGEHLPHGWARTRFGELITMVSGQHLKPSEYSKSGTYPYLTGPAEFGPRHPKCTRFTDEERAIAVAGDILVTCKGSGIGKTNLADQKIAISRQLMAVRAIGLDPEFVMLFVDDLKDDLRSKMVGIAIPGISREDILETKIELPPIQEQRRIVVKMEGLSALCEALLSKIPSKNSVAKQLADTLTSKIH